jgi:hypothetical protein
MLHPVIGSFTERCMYGENCLSVISYSNRTQCAVPNISLTFFLDFSFIFLTNPSGSFWHYHRQHLDNEGDCEFLEKQSGWRGECYSLLGRSKIVKAVWGWSLVNAKHGFISQFVAWPPSKAIGSNIICCGHGKYAWLVDCFWLVCKPPLVFL